MVQRDGKFVSFTPTAAPPPVEEPEEAPVQFTLRTLLVLQLVCAIFFGLLLMIGAFALPILFIGTVIFAAIRVRPENVPLKRMVVNLLFGVVVPVSCLVIDPWLLEGPVVRPWAGGQRLVSGPLHQFLFAAIGVQMLLFPVWRLGGRWMHRRFVALLAGAALVWDSPCRAGRTGRIRGLPGAWPPFWPWCHHRLPPGPVTALYGRRLRPQCDRGDAPGKDRQGRHSAGPPRRSDRICHPFLLPGTGAGDFPCIARHPLAKTSA